MGRYYAKSHRLTKIPVPGMGNLPLSHWSECLKPPKPKQIIAIAPGFLQRFEDTADFKHRT